jgi:hypothetical protein
MASVVDVGTYSVFVEEGLFSRDLPLRISKVAPASRCIALLTMCGNRLTVFVQLRNRDG